MRQALVASSSDVPGPGLSEAAAAVEDFPRPVPADAEGLRSSAGCVDSPPVLPTRSRILLKALKRNTGRAR